MSQSNQRRPDARDAEAVDQQRDADDALNRERGPSDRMRMPHERDESVVATEEARTPAQAQVIGQAAEDLARGLRDTDCRGQPRSESSPCPGPASEPGKRMRARPSSAAPSSRLGRVARRARRAGA